MRGLGLAMALFLMAGCTKGDEWCTQLVKDACDCEGDDPDSDLCQDAGVVADEEDQDTCESYYFSNVPEECQTETFTSDEPPYFSTACYDYVQLVCDCFGSDICGFAEEFAENHSEEECAEEKNAIPDECFE